jgi:hypothetical protein
MIEMDISFAIFGSTGEEVLGKYDSEDSRRT